jgi:hypothetical protein
MNVLRLLALLSLSLALSACSKPARPEKERPPEPKAEDATELRDMIQKPIDRAKAVEPQVLDAKAQQDAAIEAQTGGDDASKPPTPDN